MILVLMYRWMTVYQLFSQLLHRSFETFSTISSLSSLYKKLWKIHNRNNGERIIVKMIIILSSNRHNKLPDVSIAVVYDAECPYWDQASLNNTKTQTLSMSYYLTDLSKHIPPCDIASGTGIVMSQRELDSKYWRMAGMYGCAVSLVKHCDDDIGMCCDETWFTCCALTLGHVSCVSVCFLH